MATNHYNADSAHDPHLLLLTDNGGFMPPGDIAACTASALPPHFAGVTPITRS
jgi:hypothetical protein